MAFQPLAPGKTILEETAHDRTVAHGHQAIPAVAGGRDGKLLPEASGTAAVIGNSDDGVDLRHDFQQTLDENRHARAAADGDHADRLHMRSKSLPISRCLMMMA